MQMIVHIAAQLATMHAAGYVHRDLKPGNVMWLPSKNRWTIIDLGCTAEIHKDSQLAFTTSYAAPEVCSAVRSGKQYMKVKACTLVHLLPCAMHSLAMSRPRCCFVTRGMHACRHH